MLAESVSSMSKLGWHLAIGSVLVTGAPSVGIIEAAWQPTRRVNSHGRDLGQHALSTCNSSYSVSVILKDGPLPLRLASKQLLIITDTSSLGTKTASGMTVAC